MKLKIIYAIVAISAIVFYMVSIINRDDTICKEQTATCPVPKYYDSDAKYIIQNSFRNPIKVPKGQTIAISQMVLEMKCAGIFDKMTGIMVGDYIVDLEHQK